MGLVRRGFQYMKPIFGVCELYSSPFSLVKIFCAVSAGKIEGAPCCERCGDLYLDCTKREQAVS